MRILVTGASGYLGAAFTRLALARGHQIGGMILPSEAVPAGLAGQSSLTWLRGTLAEPPWDEIGRFRPEACIHFAWIATPGVYFESPENRNYFEWSLAFVRRLRELGVHHVIGIGSCIEYQIRRESLHEERTPIIPSTTYARYKNELRLALERESQAQGYTYCWTRVFYPYGVGEPPAKLCSSIIHKLAHNEKVLLKTPESTKDYIYFEDVADALVLLLELETRGVVNVGTGIPTSVRQIAQALGRMTGKSQLIEEVAAPETDPLDYVVADASRLRGLGWRPAHDLEAGLSKLLQAAGVPFKKP